jgi:AcrR family transcriptional regulator
MDAPTRERILQAAREAFAAHGLAGARVDAIAKRADCNKQLIYHYFGDKAGLYEAVVRDVLSLRPPIGSLTRGTLEQRVDTLLEQELPLRREWMRMMSWEALQSPEGPLVAEEARRAHLEGAVAEVEAAQEAGVLDKSLPPRLLILAMMSVCMLPLLLPQLARLLTGLDPASPEFQKEHGRMVRWIARRLVPG